MLAINGLNIEINYVGGDFMTALSGKHADRFFHLLYEYGGVFGDWNPDPSFSRQVGVQDKLGLQWRNWLTCELLGNIFRNRAYYKISYDTRIDNPDERIAQGHKRIYQRRIGIFIGCAQLSCNSVSVYCNSVVYL